ncbi:hypothetical protein X474_21725 [Dethiosulfatarculus sandiegensis]|uniref:Uncharacterized protein n=1 Tax=Dethiosulfatarculus sandiegensis TaxID=1429043 RepID=A0A0D2HN27_9BACT|nr:hypothetical protein X474_21725 [Dethiosulfatarculus sandiegensis]
MVVFLFFLKPALGSHELDPVTERSQKSMARFMQKSGLLKKMESHLRKSRKNFIKN